MHISINKLLDQKRMSRYELAQKIDVTYPTITAIYNETTTSIKLDILEKICNILDCTPNDILIFDSNDNKNVVTNDITQTFEEDTFSKFMPSPK